MGSCRSKAQDGEGSFGERLESAKSGLSVRPLLNDSRELIFSPPFASQAFGDESELEYQLFQWYGLYLFRYDCDTPADK